MPKYIVEESVPSYVTWRAEVEARSETEAVRKFMEGKHGGEEGPLFGDAIETLPVLRTVRLKEP